MENANCRRRIVQFGQRRDLAVPPPLQASFCRMAERETERAKLNRKRYE
jgi:hypothetical protein